MPEMTDTERRVLEAWAAEIPIVKAETHLDMIRDKMRETAYHEAGHAAVAAFFGDDHSHFAGITIVPTSDYKGAFRQDRVLRIPWDSYSPRLAWIRGHFKIMYLLAGRLAAGQVCTERDSIVFDIEDTIDGGWEEALGSEDQWRQATDEGRALVISEAIARSGWPWHRILNRAEQWTGELLDIPMVWGTVDRLAQRLLDVGAIDDFDEYHGIVEGILFSWMQHRKWRRFGNIKGAER